MEGVKTPAGTAGQVRPRRSVSIDAAHRPPRGKRSAWNGNQHLYFKDLTVYGLKRRPCDGVFLFAYMYLRCKLFCSNGLSIDGYIFLYRYKFWTLVNNGSEVLV